MNKKFHSRSKFFLNEFPEAVNFFMCLTNIQIPGNCHVTINMQYISEFYHPQIMDIDPVRQAAVI